MNKDYTVYNYKIINVSKVHKYKLLDAVGAFGYEIVETKENGSLISLTLKRESELKNKEQLDKLFDEILVDFNDLSSYEKNIKLTARITSIIIGITGLLTFGGGMSMFMVNDTISYQIGGVIIGSVGLLIMLITDLLYKKMYNKSNKKYIPKINELNEKINDICVKANRLLKESFE